MLTTTPHNNRRAAKGHTRRRLTTGTIGSNSDKQAVGSPARGGRFCYLHLAVDALPMVPTVVVGSCYYAQRTTFASSVLWQAVALKTRCNQQLGTTPGASTADRGSARQMSRSPRDGERVRSAWNSSPLIRGVSNGPAHRGVVMYAARTEIIMALPIA